MEGRSVAKCNNFSWDKTLFLRSMGIKIRSKCSSTYNALFSTLYNKILLGDSPVESRQNGSPKRPNESPEWGAPVREGGRATCHFSNNSTMKQYFKILIFTRRCVFLALSLLQCQRSPISFLQWTEPIKNAESGRPVSVDYTPFYRQHLCGGQCTQEQSRPQQHTRKVSSLLFFPLKLLLHKVYISNILCGLRLWVQDANSKRSLSLAMFILTS